jgi:malate dehydrogenase
VPVLSLTSVNGVPLTQLIPADRLQKIVERTQKGGGEIVELLKMGSAFYAPSASQAEMVRAVVNDEHRVIPVTAAVTGQYGFRDLYLGVPARIGRKGVEAVYEVQLSDEERLALQRSADAVKQDIALLPAE